MRYVAVTIFIFLFTFTAVAHEVTGKVEVVLKDDKQKQDLSGVVVYLDQTRESTSIQQSASKKEYTMGTRDKQFSPRVLVVPVGASVDFPNYDPIFHNLFSVSKPNDFDLGLYKGGTSKMKSFVNPGIVRVYCNVHPQMVATIVVANSTYFTMADKDGNYALSQVPQGSYILRAYTEEGQTEQKIDVGENPLNVRLTIDAKAFKKIKHKNKFGKDYKEDNERY